MAVKNPFDFWYAVNNTRVVLMPVKRLETFGNTILNYHLICELMDSVGQVRVREGRIQAYRPLIVTPESYVSKLLEGFGDEAERYAEWLREHSQELRILQYGFKIRKEELNQHIISDTINAVIARVEQGVRAKDDPLAAVVTGVDDSWEVCLLKLMADVFQNSFPGNVRELERHRLFGQAEDSKTELRGEIDAEFQAAAGDADRINKLGKKLEQHGLFREYEDRFFALLQTAKKKT